MIQVFFLPRRCGFFKLKTAFFALWSCFLVKTPCHSNIQRFLIKTVHARSHLSTCMMLDFSCSRTCNDLPKITQTIRPTMTIEQCRTGPVKPILTIPSPCLPKIRRWSMESNTETRFSDFVYHTATIQLLCMFTKMPTCGHQNHLWDVHLASRTRLMEPPIPILLSQAPTRWWPSSLAWFMIPTDWGSWRI